MDFLDPLCSLNLRSVETALELADLEGGLDGCRSKNWHPVNILVPAYLNPTPLCPSKGRYFLIEDGSGELIPICSYHHRDKAFINSLIMEIYVNRLFMYEGMDFIMGAQGKRTGIDDLLHILFNDIKKDGFKKAWDVWMKENAVDCSALAIEAIRDALEMVYHNNTLIPDTNALSLGKYEGKYPYTEKVKTSVRPADMTDPCLELKPGDLCIIKDLPHTTVFLGRYREKKGDNTPYWIWASTGKGKIAIFTHEEFRKAYKNDKEQAVSRWNLRNYNP
ncbi:hypothetical protein FTO70_10385 [Methanosarcina sp. KYL-1]|uniref:hypothetical protein n=1 Tax=Methanosarcina sp. KYL-1 TaxID=2602068 RepID=UPI00210153FA|nr:hypothetical protein [Methanosarcina sp. KYL-1]MCQ1536079.1 hypothetical protein [Methanosarcina sp. KYL-1]